MQISIYGAGYVGSIAGVCFANLGHKVLCCDVDEKKIESLKLGKSVLYEPFFDEMLFSAIEKENIQFTTDIKETAAFSNFHLMCVGTPTGINGEANLSFLFAAIQDVASYALEPFIVIIKSTVPVGTSYLIAKQINEVLTKRNVIIPFDVVSCPEFLAQGEAVKNFMHPERLIIGTDSQVAFEKVKALYAPLVRLQEVKDPPIILMSPSSAELTKYASNLFLATKISFMNEICRIAALTGADISEVVHGMVADSRIGPAMSRPGCGFGGSCFPKDIRALIHQAEDHDYTPSLLHAVLDVNKNQRDYFINQLFQFFKGDVRSKIIAIWGLSFKPHTDDLRESVSCDLIEALLNAGAIVQAYDPVSGKNAKIKFSAFSNFIICATKEEALERADLLAVMTDWPEFFNIDAELMKNSMKQAVLFDGRNMYDSKVLTGLGISYYAIGKEFIPELIPVPASSLLKP